MPRIRPARRSGWKTSRRVGLLAGAQELDREAGDGGDRERRAAAGVAVDLGQDQAGHRDRGDERLGDGDGLLAGHGVDDEQRLDRLDRRVHGGDLGHQRLVDGEAAGGVEDDDVADLALGGLDALAGDLGDAGAGRGAEDRDVEALAERLELVGGGRAVRVGGDEQRPAAQLDDVAGELGGGRRLARALEADHRDDRRVARQVEGPVAGRQERRRARRGRSSRPAGRRSGSRGRPRRSAFSRTRATKSLTTLKLTSASSSASRTSRIAASTSASLIRPRPVRLPRVLRRRSLRVSNMVRVGTPGGRPAGRRSRAAGPGGARVLTHRGVPKCSAASSRPPSGRWSSVADPTMLRRRAQPVRFRSLWRNSAFVRVWAATTVSVFGSLITRIALPLVAILVLGAGPIEIADPAQPRPRRGARRSGWSPGAWVDRLRRRPVLIWADLGRAVLLGSIPAAFVLGVLHVPQLLVVDRPGGRPDRVLRRRRQRLPADDRRARAADRTPTRRCPRAARPSEFLAFGISGFLVQLLSAPVDDRHRRRVVPRVGGPARLDPADEPPRRRPRTASP